MAKIRKRNPPPEAGETPSSSAEPVSDQGLKWSLYLLVFVAGAVLMGLEIAASRLLAPYFGNSVFVWGSLISVFLIALSLGYYGGGVIADRYPNPLLLNGICVAVSFAILLIAFVSRPVAEAMLVAGFGEQSGPFLASTILFLPPSIGMGIVSPFTVRLATSNISSVGRITGALYAFSTLGSIVGTLLTTFILIPNFGILSILKGLAVVLLAVSTGCTIYIKRSAALTSTILGVGILVMAVVEPQTNLVPHVGEWVHLETETPYHYISVVDRGGARELRFDRYVETAVMLAPPHQSVADYTDYFHLAFLLKPEIKRTLFIGAGGGVGPRTFSIQNPQMQIDVVDIDPKVLQIAHELFFLEESPNIHLIAQDGRMFLRGEKEKYDCLVLDAFTIGGRIPFHLATQEFFQLCEQHLTDDGVFVMNINSAVEGGEAEIFQSIFATLRTVFDHTYVFAKDHDLRGLNQSMNVILVATKQKPKFAGLQGWIDQVKDYHSESYVDTNRIGRAAGDLVVDPPVIDKPKIFTDDYAPIDSMSF